MKSKVKIVKVTPKSIKALDEGSRRLSELVGNDHAKIEETARQGIEYFLSDDPIPFECKRCHKEYKTIPHTFIFHKLCSECFILFDKQKMTGRLLLIFEKKKTAYFEDSDAWVKAFPLL